MAPKLLLLQRWNNKDQRFDSVGAITCVKNVTGFKYAKDYKGESIDPINLPVSDETFISKSRKGGLFSVLKDFLPGPYGEQIIRSLNPDYKGMTDFEKLCYLGTRDLGGFKIVDPSPRKDSPVIGNSALEKTMNNSILKTSEDIRKAFDEKDIYSLAGVRGAAPKAIYQSKDGTEYIVKTTSMGDDYNVPRVEAGVAHLQRKAGINAAITRTAKLSNGRDLLLSQRYDKGDPIPPTATTPAFHRERFNRISFLSLMEDRLRSQISYADLATVIRDVSSNPDEDIKEFFRRAVFHVGCNNVDNNIGNFEMILLDEGWRLAPSYDVLPDVEPGNNFAIPISPRHNSREQIVLGEEFIEELGGVIGLSAGEARQEAKKVVSAITDWRESLEAAGVSKGDIDWLDQAFDSEKLKSLRQELEGRSSEIALHP